MRKSTFFKWGLLMTIALHGFAQVNFEPLPLVSIPGMNTNFEIGCSYFGNETPVFICWEHRSDSTGFSIYRMNIWPDQDDPIIIATASDSLLNPDVNFQGDVVWQERENGYWVVKHYSEETGNTEDLTDGARNSTQPTFVNSILVYVQGTHLIYLNLYDQQTAVIDSGVISNPALSPDTYNNYWIVAYEKQVEDTTSIFVAAKRPTDPPFGIIRYSTARINKYPRFGTEGGIVYQTLEDGLWSVNIDDWVFENIANAKRPALLTLPVPVARVVEDWLVFYECDSIVDNNEIYAYGLSGSDIRINISNLPGNDFNPHCAILSFDTVAVFWEHEVEGGREIWWAKDSFHMQGGSVEGKPYRPAYFNIDDAYPNPFNGNIRVNYSVSAKTDIEISIFDLNGRLVTQSFVNRAVGRYAYHWDGSNTAGLKVSSGVYVIKFTDAYQVLSQKIVLLK